MMKVLNLEKVLKVNNLTEELVAVIGKCSLTRNKQEVIHSNVKICA